VAANENLPKLARPVPASETGAVDTPERVDAHASGPWAPA
jgi:hypothetical protein